MRRDQCHSAGQVCSDRSQAISAAKRRTRERVHLLRHSLVARTRLRQPLARSVQVRLPYWSIRHLLTRSQAEVGPSYSSDGRWRTNLRREPDVDLAVRTPVRVLRGVGNHDRDRAGVARQDRPADSPRQAGAPRREGVMMSVGLGARGNGPTASRRASRSPLRFRGCLAGLDHGSVDPESRDPKSPGRDPTGECPLRLHAYRRPVSCA